MNSGLPRTNCQSGLEFRTYGLRVTRADHSATLPQSDELNPDTNLTETRLQHIKQKKREWNLINATDILRKIAMTSHEFTSARFLPRWSFHSLGCSHWYSSHRSSLSWTLMRRATPACESGLRNGCQRHTTSHGLAWYFFPWWWWLGYTPEWCTSCAFKVTMTTIPPTNNK